MLNLIVAILLIVTIIAWLCMQLFYYRREWKDIENEAGALLSLAVVGWLLFFWFGT